MEIKKFTELYIDATKEGKKIPKEQYQKTGNYPIIDQGQQEIAGWCDDEEGSFKNVPAILFGDHTRIIKYVEEPFFIGADGVKILCPVNKKDNIKYLYYALQAARIPNLGYSRHFKVVKELNIFTYEKSIQDKIVCVLEKIDSIIMQQKRRLNYLEELVKSRFIEMFGDENNSKKWDIVNVENVADVQVGVVIKPSQYYTDKNEGIKAFRSLNVGEGYIKDSEWVYFSKEGHQKNSKSILKENDLLIVRSGTPGTACVVTKDYVGSNTIDLIIAHPNCEKVNPYYLCTFTNMPHGKKQISEGIGGAAQQHFNVGKYNKLKLMLPPMKIQNKFVEFLREIDKSKHFCEMEVAA